MQTTINVEQAFGIAGEIYDLTPYRVDANEVATAVTFGTPAGRKSDGTVGAIDSTYSTFVGVFVRPKEEVSYGTVTGGTANTNGTANPLAPTLTVPAGRTVQIMSMGRVVVAKPTNETWTAGTAVYWAAAVTSGNTVTTPAHFTTTSSGNTLIGKIVKGGASADTLAVVQIG